MPVMVEPANVVDAMERHLAVGVSQQQLLRARRDFLNLGFVKVSFLAPDDVKARMAEEIEILIAEHGVRRELLFKETDNSPRRMSNVRSHEIRAHGSVVPAVYSSEQLREALAEVAGEEVLECPYEPERFVITELTRSGDTHGWHWDDYSFALVWVVACPELADGGFVQGVPRTSWDKAAPRLHQQFVDQPIHSLALAAGDLYLMRTDTTLHRVYPVTAGRRLIVNMGYAARRDLAKTITHETMDSLWDGDGTAR